VLSDLVIDKVFEKIASKEELRKEKEAKEAAEAEIAR